MEVIKEKEEEKIPNKALIITFDDGHKGNYKILPIIKKYDIPITIFVCSGIIGTNRHFWFKHDTIDSSELKNVPNKKRLEVLKNRGFKQTQEFSSRQTLSEEEIKEMKKEVDFQSHTMFHPCLPKCTYKEAKEEIFESKSKLEDRFGLNISAISYPNGDYSKRDIELCKKAGYDCGITVDYGFNTITTNPYRLKRLSVNDTDNLDELIVKSSGVWVYLKKLFGKTSQYGFSDEPIKVEDIE